MSGREVVGISVGGFPPSRSPHSPAGSTVSLLGSAQGRAVLPTPSHTGPGPSVVVVLGSPTKGSSLSGIELTKAPLCSLLFQRFVIMNFTVPIFVLLLPWDRSLLVYSYILIGSEKSYYSFLKTENSLSLTLSMCS